MKKYVVIGLLIFSMSAFGQKLSREDYIRKYKHIAQQNMLNTGIPASITIAQGMLESGNGNSRLAQKANNHFGIKCHNWKGRKIYHDDDARGECFRRYKSPEASYQDHSDFLTRTPRYQVLFELDEDDYKAWAKGLKKTGYATSRTYDKSLIRIIEENNLHELDREVIAMREGNTKPGKSVVQASIHSHTNGFVDDEKTIKNRNDINYVMVKKGETIEDITEKLELFAWEIPKYNEFEYVDKVQPEPGDILYIQPKRRKASREHTKHVVQPGEDMHTISQKYGIKLKRLYKLNRMDMDEEPAPGVTVNLRSKRDKSKDSIQLTQASHEKSGEDKQDPKTMGNEVKVVFDPDE